jgi:Ser/Thr protein kinase RdoA (MazF antagonist)
MKEVLQEYGFSESDFSIQPLGNGLINSTWLVESAGRKFVLQKVNHSIFKFPEDIAYNIRMLASHLKEHHPGYLFVAPVQAITGNDLVKTGEDYFRLFPFVNNSHTIDVVEKPEQAYEAARQFGRFTRLLSGFDTTLLKITLPDFHNLPYRYDQFAQALQHGNKERIGQSETMIAGLKGHIGIVEEFKKNKFHLKSRCTHHDTKISNVLFDAAGKGLCVIDLDTVMPGQRCGRYDAYLPVPGE